MNAIRKFDGEYAFLSNFYPHAEFFYNGRYYYNAETAFQATKMSNPEHAELIANSPNPSIAKRYGRKYPMRDDWEIIKIQVMHDILFAKFSQSEDLKQKLLATGDAYLEEGNTWKDTFWGVDSERGGLNHLGKLLMQVRSELR